MQKDSSIFSHEEWKALVTGVQDATESGRLIWEVAGGPLKLEQKQTALRFTAAFDGTARISFFGRFRGFSYEMGVYREGTEGYLYEDSITVTNKEASEGIAFNVLFRTIREKVNEAWRSRKAANRDKWIAWMTNCVDGLPLHEHVDWDWDDDSPDVWIDELGEDHWVSLISKVESATEAQRLTWFRDESVSYTKYRAQVDANCGVYIDVDDGGEQHGFGLDVPETSALSDSFGYYSQSDGELERLAELIGASNKRQFEEMVKEDALQGFLTGLRGNPATPPRTPQSD